MRVINYFFAIFFLLVLFNIPVNGAQDSDKQMASDYYRMGNLYYQQGRYKEAQEQYEKAMEFMKKGAAEKNAKAREEKTKEEPKKTTSDSEKKEAKNSFYEYKIGEDDNLKISVWQNADLDQEAIVRPDGMISFPLIGDVKAVGLTIPQLDQEITKRLSEFVREPEVSISLRRIGGNRIILLGEVSSPGVYTLPGNRTILELIGKAGGFTRDSVPSSTILIRGGLSNPVPQRLNLSKVLNGKEFSKQNIILQAEDIVFVPKKFIANLSYVLGQILSPVSQGNNIRQQYEAETSIFQP
jgi:polysaccharide export outer membrane protein